MKLVIDIPDGTDGEVRMVADAFSLAQQRTTFGSVSMLVIKNEDEEMAALHRGSGVGKELPTTVNEAVIRNLDTMRMP